jgi:hypothetical protein
MPTHQTRQPGASAVRATCPECGASVPVVGGRWLYVHRKGSAEYAYPRGENAGRCPGSLFPVETPSAPSAGPPPVAPLPVPVPVPAEADRRGQVAGS